MGRCKASAFWSMDEPGVLLNSYALGLLLLLDITLNSYLLGIILNSY